MQSEIVIPSFMTYIMQAPDITCKQELMTELICSCSL